MILAFDTYYRGPIAKTVCIAFKNWTDAEPVQILKETLNSVPDYEPGAFYKRELPCIASLLKTIDLQQAEAIIVDGFVILDDDGKYGLGGHLYEHLNREVPVIGVAKTNFAQNNINKREIFRGKSAKPLYITAIGTDIDSACQQIMKMHGEFRIPTLLKQLDMLTRK